MDLAQLDDEATQRAEQRSVDERSAAGSSRRRPRHGHRSRGTRPMQSSEFNRRLQLVLFVTLLLVGIVVMMRTCSGGAPATEPDVTPAGSHRP